MYGFLSLDNDANTVRGITFYEHGETPGLGGEIDNAAWQESWVGKQLFDDQGNVRLHVIKGAPSTRAGLNAPRMKSTESPVPQSPPMVSRTPLITGSVRKDTDRF